MPSEDTPSGTRPPLGGPGLVEGQRLSRPTKETTMTQIQLTDTQSIILSTACGRADGMVFPITAKLKGGAVGNLCKSLLKHALLEEVAATDLNTVWRHDEERGSITLRATPLAYSTFGITDDPTPASSTQIMTEPPHRRTGTKQDTLIAMLRAPAGATIAEIVEATGWLSHYADVRIMPM